jgi:hypothetical protein
MDDDLERRAAELLYKCDSEESTTAEIDQILKDHSECFELDFEECELCEYIDFDILAQLAFNPVITPEQQDFVMEKTLPWQGRIEGVLDSFAMNINVADSIKPYILDIDFITFSLTDWDDFPQTLRELYEQISKNPRFTESELAKFREEANRVFSAGI